VLHQIPYEEEGKKPHHSSKEQKGIEWHLKVLVGNAKTVGKKHNARYKPRRGKQGKEGQRIVGGQAEFGYTQEGLALCEELGGKTQREGHRKPDPYIIHVKGYKNG